MALAFNGTTQYLNSGWIPSLLTTSPLSICFWMKTTTGTNSVHLLGALSATPTRGIQLFTAGAPAGSKLRLQVLDGVATTDAQGTIVVNDGVWHHVAIVRDLVADKWYTYIDGVKDIDVADACNTDFTVLVPMYFGARNWPTPGYITCTLDDILVGQFTATQAQIQTLAKSKRRLGMAVFGSNLARWWDLQGANGAAATGASSVRDYSTNAGHATPVNSPLYEGSPLTHRQRPRVISVPRAATDIWDRTPFGADAFSKSSEPSPTWTRTTEPTPTWT